MNTLRVIIVDDERVGRSRLRRLLEAQGAVEIVAECGDGAAAVEAVRTHRPDVLLLDIQMAGMDGFDVLKALEGDPQPQVIFVTAFNEHAVRAFDACALDYLLKPTTPARLAKAIARARERLRDSPPANAPEPAPVVTTQRRFTVRSGGRVSFVAPEEIEWVEAAGNYAILHTGGANHMIRETMSALEAQLSPNGFLRLSRFTIVNLRRITELRTSAAGEHIALLESGERLPVTRGIRELADRLKAL